MKYKKLMASVTALGIVSGMFSVSASAAASDDFSGYVLMNIPYSQFYSAENSEIGDVDAITSATNKTGNYGKTGGAYHSGVTAGTAEDGSVAAVGKDNGSKVQGVIWAVKVDSIDAVKALGGSEITDESSVTVATMGHGSTNSTVLNGYQALSEAPAYSYYVLDSAPANYLELDGSSFKAGSDSTSSKSIDVSASYGTHWGDVQLEIGEAEEASDKIINAMVITAEDGTTKGLYHLDQIWSFNQIAWNIDATEGLDGKKITGIRYYCSVKDADVADTSVPAYENYVYDYNVDVDVSEVYTGEVTGKFRNEKGLDINGLPADAQNVKARVYFTTGGRDAEYSYITPVTVNNRDGFDMEYVDVNGTRVSIEKGSVTDSTGAVTNFGELTDGTEYTVDFTCDNYYIRSIKVVYNASENVEDSESESSVADSSASSAASSSTSSKTSSAASSSSSKASSQAATKSTSNPTTGSAAGGIMGATAILGGAVLASRRKKN